MKESSGPKIRTLIERFFIIAGIAILSTTLIMGLYFNKHVEDEMKKNNLQKIHSILGQLLIPSLKISDTSELRRLLYMASSNNETFLIVDTDDSIIMADYDKKNFLKYARNNFNLINSCSSHYNKYAYIDGNKYLINCSELSDHDIHTRNNKYGFLLSFTNYKMLSFSPIMINFVAILLIIFLVLMIGFRRMLYRGFLKPLMILQDGILSRTVNNETAAQLANISNAPSEIIDIKDAFNCLLESLQKEYNGRIKVEKMKALFELSAGVAHDIRSPLTALDLVVKEIKSIPEQQRMIIRNSTTRIHDIANNLLTHYRYQSDHDDAIIMHTKAELISDLLIRLISEKRVQFSKNMVDIVLNVSENSYGRFSLLAPSSFNRVISNILDNSVEASASTIKMTLEIIVKSSTKFLGVKIQDNGLGIDSETLKK